MKAHIGPAEGETGQADPAGMQISAVGQPLGSMNPGQIMSPAAQGVGQIPGQRLPSFPT